MKRQIKKVLSLLLLFAILIPTSLPALAAEAESVYIRIESQNSTIVPRTKVEIDNFALTPYGAESNAATSRAVHAIIRGLEESGLDPKTADVFDATFDYSGGYISKIASIANTSTRFWMYSVNNADPGVGICAYELNAGDEIVIYHLDYLTDLYADFDQTELNALQNELFSLTLNTYDFWGGQTMPVEGAAIVISEKGGKTAQIPTAFTTDSTGTAEIKIEEAGEYVLSAVKENITTPYCKVTISEKSQEQTVSEAVYHISNANRNTKDLWMAAALSKLGKADYVDKDSVIKEAIKIYQSASSSATDIEKAIIALSGVGIDASLVSYDGSYLNFIEKLTAHSDLAVLINANVFGLLAIDSAEYNTLGFNKNSLITFVLSKECTNGGWAFFGDTPDADMTAMVITALSPYYAQNVSVKEALDRGLSYLLSIQTPSADFDGGYGPNSMTTATVITALYSLGIDVSNDGRFIIEGKSPIDALLSYQTADNRFGYQDNTQPDVVATLQALRALGGYLDYNSSPYHVYHFGSISSDAPKTVHIRIESQDSTLVPRTTLTVDNFALTGYTTQTTSAPSLLHAIILALKSAGYSPLEDGSLTGTDSAWGYYITSIGTQEPPANAYWMFAVNNADPGIGVTSYELKNNDEICVYLMDAAGAYAWFEPSEILSEQNAPFEITLVKKPYGADQTPVSNAVILKSADGKTYTETPFTTDAAGKAAITLSESGTIYLSASKGLEITRPYAKIELEKTTGTGGGSTEKTVVFSIQGKTTILAPSRITVGRNDTVFTILKNQAAKNKIDVKHKGSAGQEYVYQINSLAEFDDGPNSGWLYEVGGKQPGVSIASYVPVNNDTIRIFYSGDFTKETSVQGGSSGVATANPSSYLEKIKPTLTLLAIKLSDKKQLSDSEAFGLALNKKTLPESYFENLTAYLAEKNGDLRLITEYCSIALTLKQAGKDISHFAGFDLAEKIYNFENPGKQGVNGYVFALIALGNEEIIPDNAKWNLQKLIHEILPYQNPDGGFPLALGSVSDSDITAMTLTALAPYKEEKSVAKTIDYGISYLINAQKEDGTHGYGSDKTAESTAQIIIALSELGIDATDSRFVKKEKTLLDVLYTYKKTDNTFSHVVGGGSDPMATEQAFLALTAYYLRQSEDIGIYNRTPKAATEIPIPKETEEFSDAALISPWALEFVKAAKQLGIVKGDETNNVNPKNELTRSEFVAMLLRTMQIKPQDSYTPKFGDVSANSWYAGYVLQAAALKIVSGTEDNLFLPDNVITRQDMAVMLSRALHLSPQKTQDIKDLSLAADYAKPAIEAVFEAGIMQGSENHFNPTLPTTREMAIVVMVRLAQSME